MTITDRETPDTVTPTIEDLVLGWCDSMEQRIADVREAVAGVEAHAATVADLVGPPTSVDLRDPLAPFKMADGTVCYLSIPVGGLRAGDWFQRQHGDPDWHHVRLLIFAGDRIGVLYDEASPTGGTSSPPPTSPPTSRTRPTPAAWCASPRCCPRATTAERSPACPASPQAT